MYIDQIGGYNTGAPTSSNMRCLLQADCGGMY